MVTAWPWNLPERSAARGSQIPRTTRDHAPCNPALNAWMRSLNYSSRKTTERKDLRMNPLYGTKFKLEQYFHKSGWNGKMNIIYRELVKLLANMWLKSTLSLWTYVKKKNLPLVSVSFFVFCLSCCVTITPIQMPCSSARTSRSQSSACLKAMNQSSAWKCSRLKNFFTQF